mmetsp:Transcript_87526/g.128005  ORF Transcript_87526/g.128005 Transcript_87526/m.128005 type:complete len:358 (-) Transcript_87526:561-1634(-)
MATVHVSNMFGALPTTGQVSGRAGQVSGRAPHQARDLVGSSMHSSMHRGMHHTAHGNMSHGRTMDVHGMTGNTHVNVPNMLGAASMHSLLDNSDPRTLTLALLSQQLHADSRSSSHDSLAAHRGVAPAAPFLLQASDALAILQYLNFKKPDLGPQGLAPTLIPHLQAATETAARSCSQEEEDLGPIVDVRGLHRRQFGRRISAFNFFVKEMVPQIRLQAPGLVHQECMKRVAEKWQGMSKEDKAKWCFDPSVPKSKKRRRMSPSLNTSSATSEGEGVAMPPAKTPKFLPSLPPLSSLINSVPSHLKNEHGSSMWDIGMTAGPRHSIMGLDTRPSLLSNETAFLGAIHPPTYCKKSLL